MENNHDDLNPKVIWVMIIFFVLSMVLLNDSFFLVPQKDVALKLRFGNPVVSVKDSLPVAYGPGFHMRIPFADKPIMFDSRLRIMSDDIPASRPAFTNGKQPLDINYYVVWKISNLKKYYTTTGDITSSTNADSLIQQNVRSQLRKQVGRYSLDEVVKDNREAIMKSTLAFAKKPLLDKYGIDLVSFRIKQIELAKSTLNSVYEAMQLQRASDKASLLFEGKSEKVKTVTLADLVYAKKIAKAQFDAQTKRAIADGVAAQIYSTSYEKYPKFYAFYRSLLAYSGVFDKGKSIVVLKPSGDFLRYFNSFDVNQHRNVAQRQQA
jgi:modulator of FtsH protease HflC